MQRNATPRKNIFQKTSFSASSRGYQVEGKKKISAIRSEKRNFGFFQYIAVRKVEKVFQNRKISPSAKATKQEGK